MLLAILATIGSLTMNEIEKPATLLMGIECRTENSPDRAPNDIPKLWERFFAEQIEAKIPNRTTTDVIALYCDYEGDFTKPYSLVIGCEVSSETELPDGMVVKTIPASKFLVYKAVGQYPTSVIDTWGKIWSSDLKRTYTGDYELYTQKLDMPPTEVDVLIAIE